MTVQRPGSSVLKPGVREKQRELETVIGKYELLLSIGRTKNPDFESLNLPQLVFNLAECRLCLIRLQRTAWQIDLQERELIESVAQVDVEEDGDDESPSIDSMETMLATLQDMLMKTRLLYQLPEVANSFMAVQGEIHVLIETGELLTVCKEHANAMDAYAEAIRLCYNIEDEATEAILTLKLQKLQRHADTTARLKSPVTKTFLDGDESDRRKLQAVFENVANTNGILAKDKFHTFSKELGMHYALTNNEVDEIWRQILQTNRSGGTASLPEANGVSFEAFWAWWMSETQSDSMQNDTLL